MKKEPYLINKYGYLLSFAVLSALIVFSTSVNCPLTDSFHEGEYVGFMWHMRDYYKGLAVFPLYVHGAIDYIPSLIASILYGHGNIIVGTRVVNTLIVGVNWMMFLHLCYSMIPEKNRNIAWIAAVMAIFYCFAPNMGSDAFTVSSQYLGVRDTFLLLSLLFYAKTLSTDKISNLLLACGSLSTILSIYWCYDRGIISIILFTTIAAGLSVNKKYFNSFVMIMSALVFILIFEYLNIFGSIKNNANNYIYWIKNSSEISGYPIDSGHLYGYLGLVTLGVFGAANAATAFTLSQGSSRNEERRNIRLLITGMIVVQLLVIKIVFNRADIHRSFIGVWPSIVLMFYFCPRLITFPFDRASIKLNTADCKGSSFQHSAFKITLMSFLLFIAVTSPQSPRYVSFMSALVHPAQDTELVSQEINAVSSILKNAPGSCYFGWSNEGVIALMSNKRFCTEYPYVHYASRRTEPDMLAQLIKESPPAIVYTSSIWAMTIDGKHMSERFPLINTFIQTNYRKEIRVGNYGVVLKDAP